MPPEVSAELMRLRRKLSDLTADNSLLTQNFLMVQTRYREVSGQKDDERRSQEAELTRAKDAADNQLASVRNAHTSIMRSELVLLEATIQRKRATAAAAALSVAVRSRYRSRLTWGLARWLRGLGYAAHLQLERITASKSASQSAAVALRGARLADSVRHLVHSDQTRARVSDLSYACRRWRLAIVRAEVAALREQLQLLEAAKEAAANEAKALVEERQGMLESEKAHSEALGKEMQTLAEHARACEKAAQQQQQVTFEVTREKDAMVAKVAESELQHQLVKQQLEAAHAETRRTEAAKDAIQKERDQFLQELRQTESEARALTASSEGKSVSAQQNSARLIAVVTELRRRLAAVESAREKERKQLSAFQASCLQLQGQVQQQRLQQAELYSQEQQRNISSAQLAQARMDADAQLAFNAELLAFANKHDLDLASQDARSRATSPLGRAQALAATPARGRRM